MRIENTFVGVPGVGERTEQKLWRAGVTHWDRFDGSVVGRTRAERIEEFIDVARDRLARNDARFFDEAFPSGSRWRLYENFREGACFLDIETTGLSQHRDEVTVVSIHRGGETTTLVRGDDLSRESLAAEFDAAELLVTFNGARFDVPFVERAFDLDVDLPHIDLLSPCRRLDLTGGLKSIERAVGIGRDGPEITGRDAVRLWHRHERGDDDALDRLVAYNRDDTENLRTLMDVVANRLHETVFESVHADGA